MRFHGFKAACWMAMVWLAIPLMEVEGQCEDERMEAPGAVVHGKTIAEWTAAWWQWIAGIPSEGHPILAGGENCAGDQDEPVFLLSGSFLSILIGDPFLPWEGCVIPCGKPILLEVWSVLTGPPGDCEPDRMEDCVNLAAEYMDTLTTIEVTLDGRPLPCLEAHREKSAVFEFLMAPDNIFMLGEPLLRKGVADGIWVMLKPLPPGVHVIDMRAIVEGLELPRLYHITVAPCGVASFRRGDADGNQVMDLTDAVAILEHLVMERTLACTDAADADDNGVLDLADAIYTLNHLFLSGAAPAAPGPDTCGADPTANDELTCGKDC